jgi:broad specificity phosphatase PhoE
MNQHRSNSAGGVQGADPDSGSAFATSVVADADPAAGRGLPPHTAAIVLVRHGETEWSRSGQHTGRTDIPLTAAGEDQARSAGDMVRLLLAGQGPALVVSSPRRRALRTAELAGFVPTEVTEDVGEWDYGSYEGLTSAQIHEQDPGWSIWSKPVPNGETAEQITARLDRLLTVAKQQSQVGPVVIFSHGHASRCLAARWLDEPVAAGRHYWLGTGAVSSLGYEHSRTVILHWNLDRSVLAAS